MSESPPRFAERLLAFVLPESMRDPFLADLADVYARREPLGSRRRWYWSQVARTCWPPNLVALHLQARDAARGRLGIHTEINAMPNLGALIESIVYDARLALRGFRRRPWWAAMIVATLALGIGANSTMFGVLAHLLLEAPPHIAEPNRVFTVHTRTLGKTWVQSTHPYVYRTMLRDVSAFSDVAVATPTAVVRRQYFPVGHGETATRVAGALVSGNYFSVLGARPALGRFFTERESGTDDGDRVAVLGYDYWRSHFEGRADVLGRSMEVGNARYTIVGVTPSGFTGTELRDVDVWLPIAVAPGLRFAKQSDWTTTLQSQWLLIVARLKPGVTQRQAEAQATIAYRNWSRAHATDLSAREIAQIDSEVVELGSLIPGKSPWEWNGSGASSDVRVSLLMASVAFAVLLIACANVANLLLVRALGRRREVAVRLALGVSRGRLLRQFVIEGLVLSGAGTLGAIAITVAGSQIVRRWLIGDGAWSSNAMTMRVFATTLAIGVLTGIATSLVPALQVSRQELTSSLKAGAREGAIQRSRMRTGLLVTQSALAILLLAGAAMFLRSLRNVSQLDLGVDVDHVLIGQISQGTTTMSNAEVRQFFTNFEQRAKAIPGVKATAYSIGLPFALSWGVRPSVPGRVVPRFRRQTAQYAVSPGYFDALGIRTLLGRVFTNADVLGAPQVVVVNETMARLYWPNESPIGACVRLGADSLPCATVVGVVANTRQQDLVEGLSAQVYRAMNQVTPEESAGTVSFFGYTFIARTDGDPNASVASVRRALQTSAASVPYVNVQPMRDLFARQTRAWSLGARVFTAFGALALLLSGVGLFSVVLFTMNQRLHEMGVRMALGARRVDLLRLTAARGMAPAVVGIVVGVVLALGSARFLEGLLFQESPRDPATLAAAAGVMLVTAFAACLAPAWKASRIDPTIALRVE